MDFRPKLADEIKVMSPSLFVQHRDCVDSAAKKEN